MADNTCKKARSKNPNGPMNTARNKARRIKRESARQLACKSVRASGCRKAISRAIRAINRGANRS